MLIAGWLQRIVTRRGFELDDASRDGLIKYFRFKDYSELDRFLEYLSNSSS